MAGTTSYVKLEIRTKKEDNTQCHILCDFCQGIDAANNNVFCSLFGIDGKDPMDDPRYMYIKYKNAPRGLTSTDVIKRHPHCFGREIADGGVIKGILGEELVATVLNDGEAYTERRK